MAETRCGVIAIVGEPNAGKSTLINRLAGGKVSIVSPKVQTTRFNVRGVCAHENAQMIFVDTPGIFDAERNFEKAMVQAAWSGIGDADAVLLLLDATIGLKARAAQIMEKLATLKKPLYLVVNKIDKVRKPVLLELAKQGGERGDFKRIFMISALKGDGVEDIKKELAREMPEGPWLYPEDQMSDIPLRLLAAEVTREKIFMALEQELPYAIFVETEKWEEQETSVKIAQIIYVEREGQKKIVIGKGGEMLKRIGTSARQEIGRMLGKRAHLSLFVKVRPGWKNNPEHYHALGLEYKK